MKTILTFSLALGLAACGGSSSSRNNDVVDLSGPHTVGSGDLATGTGSTDMAMASTGKVGCNPTVTCENKCVMTGGSNQTIESCVMACDANETTNGASLESALKTCVFTACPAQSQDAGVTTTNSPCAYDPMTGALVSQSACDTCQMTAESSGGSCASASMACAADM